MKEVNSQLEYSWSQKYRELNELRDREYDKLQSDTQHQIKELKTKSEMTVKSLLADFKDDMHTVESTHKSKAKDAITSVAKLENKVTKQAKAIDELKHLLQMAVKSDHRKDALLSELKVAFEKEKTKVERRMNELDGEKNSVDQYKKEVK